MWAAMGNFPWYSLFLDVFYTIAKCFLLILAPGLLTKIIQKPYTDFRDFSQTHLFYGGFRDQGGIRIAFTIKGCRSQYRTNRKQLGG